MKLIPRRKKDPTTLEKALAIFSKVFQALAAVRMARGALRGYRFAKRLPLLLGGAVAALFAAKKLRGGSGPDGAAAPAPSASSAVPTPPPAPSTPGGTDAKSRAEAAVATSAGLADATATTGGEDGATDEDAGAQKPA